MKGNKKGEERGSFEAKKKERRNSGSQTGRSGKEQNESGEKEKQKKEKEKERYELEDIPWFDRAAKVRSGRHVLH